MDGQPFLYVNNEVDPGLIATLKQDLIPWLTVRLHHLTQAAHDQAIEKLCAELNATQTIFPGTCLTLVFKLGSS
jgi:hypothetical protein